MNKNGEIAPRKKSLEDACYPVPKKFNGMRVEKPAQNKEVIKRIIQRTVRLAYSLKPLSSWDYQHNDISPKAIATKEQVEMVIHLIESLQPTDAIEVALASQFAVTYIRAMESTAEYGKASIDLDFFEFGHRVLETLQKYRNKGAQQISVQYNVNQGQVVNIKKEAHSAILEGVEL